MVLTELRAKNYSRMERKMLASHSNSDGYKMAFVADTPKEVLEFVKAREKSAGFVWCEHHGDWEPIAKACNKSELYVPPKYKSEGTWGNPQQEKGEVPFGEEGNGEGQSSAFDEAETIEFTPEAQSTYKLKPEEAITKKKPNQQSFGKPHGVQVKSETNGSLGFGATDDGKVFGLGGKPVGQMKKAKQEESESKQQEGDGKQEEKNSSSSSEKKWTKLILNKCPHCKIETLQKVRMAPPAPKDDWDRLDYTEKACGCDALKGIFTEEVDEAPDDWTGDYKNYCGALRHGYVCTKRKGHVGKLHVASHGYKKIDRVCIGDDGKPIQWK